MPDLQHTRNFCIIAHIDHGKSTLADRLIQKCGGVTDREFHDQLLDSMDLERERGITIKSNTITLAYQAANGEEYTINLIDTPGHVDFSHEVRRSLMSCEGALLLIDASQGVEAQTVANLYLALEHDLEIIPVINKIDLPAADPDRVREQIADDLGLDPFEAVACSAKTGLGVDDVLEAIVDKLPAPAGDATRPLQALIFDAEYDPYRGVILLVRVFEGTVNKGDTIRLMHTDADYEIEEIGHLKLTKEKGKSLSAGDVGYMIAGIKSVSDIEIGDTITHEEAPASQPLPGFIPAKPVVFSSIFPMSADDYVDLGKALEKLKLNDAALTFTKDSSSALGFGYRCGFLGMLHLDIVQERLAREYDLSILLTAPSVQYKVTTADGETEIVENPSDYPDPSEITHVEEPYIKASILMPDKYLGSIMELLRDNRGDEIEFHYLAVGRVEVKADLPLAEVLFDFYDRLKSTTQGYGSFDYEMLDYRRADLVKVDILVNAKHQFKIPIQGSVGRDIIARRTISAMRKDVTAKCYGGDITRKRKLLEKQKEGKKRMRMFGSVEIPQEAFLAVLRADEKSR